MTLVTTEDRGAVRVITYANPPFGTMTAAGSNEMLEAVTAVADDAGGARDRDHRRPAGHLHPPLRRRRALR